MKAAVQGVVKLDSNSVVLNHQNTPVVVCHNCRLTAAAAAA
jgi:hypothetical protein